MHGSPKLPRLARTLLGLIRLVNGALGLFAPQVLIGRIDPDRPVSPTAVYAFRLFGVRTLLLGRTMLTGNGAELQQALREAPLIHASDVATSVALGVRREVPPRTAAMLAAISAVNTGLAIVARKGLR